MPYGGSARIMVRERGIFGSRKIGWNGGNYTLEEKDKGKIRSGNIFIRCKRIVCINLVFAVINFDEKFCITWKKESHAHRMEYTYNYNKIQPTVNKSMASSHPLITRKYTQFT